MNYMLNLTAKVRNGSLSMLHNYNDIEEEFLEELLDEEEDEAYEEYSHLISNRDKTQIRKSRKELHRGKVQKDEYD